MFTPVKNKKMYVLVAEQIKAMVEEGKLKPGERLPAERDMAVQFGVGRSTIREAITALEAQGLVEPRPGLGTFVRQNAVGGAVAAYIDDLDRGTSPAEVFEARMLIEPKLARLAAQRATETDISEFASSLAEAERLDDSDIEGFERHDGEFHLLIAKAADNEILLKFEESINSERMGILLGNLKKRSLGQPGRIELYKSHHRAIFQAISQRDPQRAEQESERHLGEVRAHIFDE
jgi:DNA-binding FadR family transcriptional regulator